MSASPLRLLRPPPGSAPGWVELGDPYSAVAAGTLVELSSPRGMGRTTTAASLVRAAQEEGELCAWVMREGVSLCAPDLVDAGLDLDALLFVRMPSTAGPLASVRAVELLLRSGGFGLVVLDLFEGAPGSAPSAWQGRLLGLAREHRARVVLLSSSADSADSLGPLVSVRLAPRRVREGERFSVELEVLKTKSTRFDRVAPTLYRPPAGL